MSVTNRIRVSFAIPLILVAVVGFISFRTAAQFPQATRWVEHTRTVLGKVRLLTTKLTELVNSQRAALLSGKAADPKFTEMTAAVDKEMKALLTLTVNDEGQGRRVRQLQNDLVQWNAIVQKALEARKTSTVEQVAAQLKTEEVKVLGERVRNSLRDLDVEASRLLQQRHREAQASAGRAMYVIGIGTAIAILIGLVAAIYIPRQVTATIRQLVQTVERIGHGTLGYKGTPTRADELGVLATAINTMSSNLEVAQGELQAHAAALGKERNTLRTLIDNLPEYIFVKDSECRFVVANAALMRSQGITELESVAGKTDFDYFSPQMAESYRQSDEAVLQSGKPALNIEEPITNHDGKSAWYSTTKVPLHDEDGKVAGLVGICHDITHQKEAEERIRQLNRDLEARARELETLNRELEAFSYSVSHDLRAPLRHIDGFADLLSKKAGSTLDDTSRRYLATISRSAKELGRLVDDLLSFSRMGRAEMRTTTVSLSGLARDVIRELEPEGAGRNVQWKLSDLPSVQADPAMLRLVLVNLLANAIKYSRTRDAAEIEIGSMVDGTGELVVFVRDNGVGFDMQYASKLFGVFQRLHSADDFEGTGIGLANVRRIIHRHGGRTWAEGAIDQGATFYFSLPRLAEAA
jgi:PAS domain S-box-containing protein